MNSWGENLLLFELSTLERKLEEAEKARVAVTEHLADATDALAREKHWREEAEKLLWRLGVRSVMNGETVAWSPGSDLCCSATEDGLCNCADRVEGCGCSCPTDSDPGDCCPCTSCVEQPKT